MFPFSVARYAPIEPMSRLSEGGLFGRVPNLKDAGELAVKSIVKNLQTMAGTATTIEGSMAGFATATPRDIVTSHRAESVIGSIIVSGLSTMMLVTLDGTLVHALVELLCGSNGVEAMPAEARPATAIDNQFAQILFTLAASAVQTEWAPYGFAGVRAARLEGVLTPDIFGPRVEEVGVLELTISIFGLHGALRVVLPPDALNPFVGEEPAMEEFTQEDPAWSGDIAREIAGASVVVSAYLEAKDIPLGALAGLKIGHVLALPADARSRALLVADGQALCRGEIGRDENQYSLRIEEFVSGPAIAARATAPRRVHFDISKG